MMTTRIRVSFRSCITVGILHHLRQLTWLGIGRLTHSGREYELYKEASQNRNAGRLTEAEIAAIRQSEEKRLGDAPYRQRLLGFQMTDDVLQHPERANHYQQAILLCLPLLQDPAAGIRSVANVGTRIDVASSYLSRQFPNVKFTSIDLPSNLAEINRDLPQSPNWSFVSGYALDLFERQAVTADLVLFSYTCEVIRNRELHEYFAALSKFARHIVLNEQWWPVHQLASLFRVVRPEEIDPDHSLLGGKSSVYHHNYPAMLERDGFEILSSEIVEVYKREFWAAHIVARNRMLS